ncbi:MAG: serine/threonine protein kinase [Chloroflexi bacterium]|nr:serine/threonine protein kinase [Chloroflexota bacterium]
MARSTSRRLVGTLLGGRFRLDELLNAGGSGSVYRATDLSNGQTVVAKVLRSVHAADLERFHDETELCLQLDHPNVVRGIAGGLGNYPWYLVLEYVNGGNLRNYLIRYGNRSTLTLLYFICGQILLALDYLHDCGIVHCDLRPENVLLHHAANGKLEAVKLTDFGIAWQLGRSTRASPVLSTTPYTAPELLLGAIHGTAADFYSFGVILGELLTGHDRIVNGDGAGPGQAVAVSNDVPPPFRPLLAELLHPSPLERADSAKWVSQQLAEAIARK